MTTWGGSAVGLEQRLLARFREAGISHEAPLILGFSGGPDSLALAAALTHVRAVTGLPVRLVHVDHRLRVSSGEEAEAAVALGNQLGLPVVVRRVPVTPRQAHPNTGIEEAARRERYRLLGEEALAAGSQYIATAHHQDDQAETVLMHLLRGSGLHGAAGMAELAGLPYDLECDISHQDGKSQVRLWRPFLGEPRVEIHAYLRHRGLVPMLDPSNDDITLRRNAVRHRIIPELEGVMPGASAALARFAVLAAEEDRYLEDMAASALAELTGPRGELGVSALQLEPRAMQRRIVRRWLVEATGETTIGAERVEAVLRWAGASNSAGKIELPGKWSVRRSGGSLIVESRESLKGGEGSSE